MVSSIAEEIDLNGFIIIFTSNISKDEFPKRISPELRSRFDYKGYFMPLFHSHKEKFTEFRIKNIIENSIRTLILNFLKILQMIFWTELTNKTTKNMRDLNKKIKDTFVKSVMELLVKMMNKALHTTLTISNCLFSPTLEIPRTSNLVFTCKVNC